MTGLSSNARVIGVDLTGHGDSEKPDIVYTPSIFVNDIKKIFDKLGIEKAVLVGSSMGGFVVEEFCAKFPERMLGLVLVGTRGKPTLNIEARALEAKQIGYAEHMKKRTRKSFGHNASEELIEETTRLRLKVPEKIALSIQDAYRSYDPIDNLKKIRVPTLIIVGTEDAITPPR